MKKLAILTLAALCLALGGCKVLGEISDYFAGIEDAFHGNEAEAAPSDPAPPAAEGLEEIPQTHYALTFIGFTGPISVTVDSEALLDEPREDGFDPRIGESFGEVTDLPAGTYTVTVASEWAGGAEVSLQCDPSVTPCLFVATNADGNLRVVPLTSKALAPPVE